MRKIAAVLLTAGCVMAAGPASAHDHGGDVVGALVGGALIGAVVGAAINSAPAVVYQAPPPVYAEPAPVAPVYAEQAPVYVAAPAPAPGGCYDQYSGRYVQCAPAQLAPPPPPAQYDDGYGQPAGW
ncbi:ecotin precursor [Paraburkholderia pallida]|uniref:Ecotin n=1 Tax=Paraburkholderia pallida TaxID=2547399 RepID=A0A4P7CMT9_9BURK|nr:ecotin precursor [Paraburkholderia pallida]QBQ96207.1 ecotin precursor [Paraburkholderia pallida]